MKATALDLKRRSKQEWLMDRGRGVGILIDPWDSKFTADDLPELFRAGARAGQPPSTKGRRMPAEVYTREEVALLISAWNPENNCGARNRAMIGLFYGAGLMALTEVPQGCSSNSSPSGAFSLLMPALLRTVMCTGEGVRSIRRFHSGRTVDIGLDTAPRLS